MKQVIAIGIVMVGLIFQYFLSINWQPDWLIPNVTLAILIVLCLYMNTEQVMWLALITGLTSDLYSPKEFGFYLGFYILIVLISKTILRLGINDFSWWRVCLLVALAAVIKELIPTISIIDSSFRAWNLVVFQITMQGLISGIFATLLLILFKTGNEQLSKYFSRKGVKI